ncbi:MAG: acyl-CoA thioesterase [Muribaculaceae bacterium]|nr:acyl-CoA thioesterase [Muribaculaceae bacterium]
MNVNLPNLADFHHSLPVQLRFNDIDILGHLNNIVYFALYDLAKARFLETMRKGNVDWRKVECVIANINCTYIKQIRFGDEIEVVTRCIRLGERSFTLQQCLVEVPTREIRSICETVMVCFNPDTGASAPMSPELRSALINYEKLPVD